jgi:hypothetical protein
VTWPEYVPRPPCNVCLRCHRGPRCKPADTRSQQVCVTLPGHVHRRLEQQIPWGERSAWVAKAIENALDQ